MHHDVRVPMMLPDSSSNDLHMYANPLRTAYHRCEVPVSTAAARAPSGHDQQQKQQRCPYHTCCAPLTERRWCTAALEVARRDGGGICDIEPEECERFVLEHRHHRLQRLGMGNLVLQGRGPVQQVVTAEDKVLLQSPSSSASSSFSSLSLPSSYDPEVDYNRRWFPSQNLGKSPGHHYSPTEKQMEQTAEGLRGITATTMLTTTWRDDLEELPWRDHHGNISAGCSGSGGLAPIAGGGVFAHQGRFRGPWEEELFLAAERLYLLVSDAETHYAVLRDLSMGGVPTARNGFSSSAFPSVVANARCCWEGMATASSAAAAAAAAANYVRVRETLRAQRFLVERLMWWAGEPCLRC
ncbi:hypothetical protein SLS62_003499 [Diatrype stigma]|uniref:Uncharacterized protein n=1 Tax=Diatrype stigma TaxID=117547 RepID=A0AAN9US91_9PEZI